MHCAADMVLEIAGFNFLAARQCDCVAASHNVLFGRMREHERRVEVNRQWFQSAGFRSCLMCERFRVEQTRSDGMHDSHRRVRLGRRSHDIRDTVETGPANRDSGFSGDLTRRKIQHSTCWTGLNRESREISRVMKRAARPDTAAAVLMVCECDATRRIGSEKDLISKRPQSGRAPVPLGFGDQPRLLSGNNS